jgi:hypothetical protein
MLVLLENMIMISPVLESQLDLLHGLAIQFLKSNPVNRKLILVQTFGLVTELFYYRELKLVVEQ